MNTFIIGAMLLSSTSLFAQAIDTTTFKTLLTMKKESLEKVNPGMTKKVVTLAKIQMGSEVCGYKLTSTQSILKVESEKIIVFAKEKFSPQNTPSCRAAGYTSSTEEALLYYQDKPSLAKDLADVDTSSADIKDIFLSGNMVTVNLKTENLTLQYDLTKPSFKNVILVQTSSFKTTSEDVPDIDVKSVNLTKVLFCDNNDGDTSECSEGDYSDILY
jgi:hypothetical protein